MIKSANTMIEYKNTDQKNKFNKSSRSFTTTTEIKCYTRNLPHTIDKCPVFTALLVDKLNRAKMCRQIMVTAEQRD